MSVAAVRRPAAAAGAEIVNDSASNLSSSASSSLNNTQTNIPMIIDSNTQFNADGTPANSLASSMTEAQIDTALKRGHQHQPTMINHSGNNGIVPLPMNNSNDSLTENLASMKLSEEEAKRKAASKSQSNSISGSTSGNSAISYAAERVIGNGSFGVVYQATIVETGETVAIKKVLQDRRFKNRELQIMSSLSHPDVVALKHCFYSKGEKPDEVYLNLVMEYIPETVHRTLRNHTKANKLIPISYVKCYMWQICRSVAYIHSQGVAHRDIKPQNILMNPKTHEVKLCDFGSAKQLITGEPNVSYICSRYYRAPELVFEATEYTCSIDLWSVGCVMAELMLGNPLFPGESGVDQLIEIIKVLGTPTKEEIYCMNPNHTSFKFPQIKPHPWVKVFRNKQPQLAIDLVSKFLRYDPKSRIDPLEALAHPFFDELRTEGIKLPNGKEMPQLFNFTENELKVMGQKGITSKIIPQHLQH